MPINEILVIYKGIREEYPDIDKARDAAFSLSEELRTVVNVFWGGVLWESYDNGVHTFT